MKRRQEVIRNAMERHAAKVREQAVATPRDPHDEISFPGLGRRFVRLLVFPSFSVSESWDIRSTWPEPSGFTVFASRSSLAGERRLVGYQQLDPTGIDLAELLARLQRVRFPIWVDDDFVGCDGTTYEISSKSGFTRLHVSWWEDGPASLRELTSLVREMVATFQRLPPAG